jgi:hypothetical protein
VQCDIPITYFVDGVLRQGEDANKKFECYFNVTFKAEMGPGEIKKYGNCSVPVVNNYPCETILDAFLNPEVIVFTTDNRKIPIEVTSDTTHTAEIKNVIFPYDSACKWK